MLPVTFSGTQFLKNNGFHLLGVEAVAQNLASTKLNTIRTAKP